MPLNAENPKAYYDAQYRGADYAASPSPEAHPFHAELKGLLARYGGAEGQWLEVGCGRGLLQDVVADYTGVDIAETVSASLHKPFRCAPVEALPFPDERFDGIWSYAVLEHTDDPEQALAEMRRVLKPGGLLFLSPAWQCRPWAGRDYAWKPYGQLSWPDRIRKAAIPVRNAMAFRALAVLPRRLFRLAGYFLHRTPTRLRGTRLTPNYAEYRVVDADARHQLDPFEAVLWFRSRGDRVRSHPGWWRALFIRTGTVVVEVGKSGRLPRVLKSDLKSHANANTREESGDLQHGNVRPCTSRYIHPVVLRICREYRAQRVLDIGCGNGSLCRELADAGCAVVGLDSSPSGIALARALVPEGVFHELSVYADPATIPERDFDLVVSTEVVEHLFQPRCLPGFAYEKLRPGGLLAVSTPYHGFLKNLVIALVNGWDAHHDSEWEGGHIKFWSRRSLAHLLESNGFRVLEFHGAGRFPWFWKSMVLVARKEPKFQS